MHTEQNNGCSTATPHKKPQINIGRTSLALLILNIYKIPRAGLRYLPIPPAILRWQQACHLEHHLPHHLLPNLPGHFFTSRIQVEWSAHPDMEIGTLQPGKIFSVILRAIKHHRYQWCSTLHCQHNHPRVSRLEYSIVAT